MTRVEEWRPIAEWPGYEVSSAGRVRSIDRSIQIGGSYDDRNDEHLRTRAGRMLLISQHANGYCSVRLSPGGRTCLVHRLVCRAFHGEPPEHDSHADHKNTVRSDNRADNLRWLSSAENRAMRNFALGERCGASKLTAASVQQIYLRSVKAMHVTVSDARLAAEFGVTREAIRDIRRGKTWTHVTARVRPLSI